MFQFIENGGLLEFGSVVFKYISCSNLSDFLRLMNGILKIQIHLMFQFIAILLHPAKEGVNSNTSHVPIYPSSRSSNSKLLTFKYISCSNLSNYICPVFNRKIHSNTSHVPIYHVIGLIIPAAIGNSNTSHVPIYHVLRGSMVLSIPIQIHLMFQFITFDSQDYKDFPAFKYISCSNLSSHSLFISKASL